MSGATVPPGPDAAWVVIETPLAAADLAAFCGDFERLYRINPFLEFVSWQQGAANRFQAVFLNHSNQQHVVLEGVIARVSEFALRIDFKDGIKKCTRLEVRPGAGGSRLTITDEYRAPAGAAAADQAQVDRSLHAWGVALKTYLERDRRWGRFPFYRWYARRVWLPMKPSARRITFLVLAIGLADLLLIAVGFAIYWLEAGR